jgi:hypothetical protein
MHRLQKPDDLNDLLESKLQEPLNTYENNFYQSQFSGDYLDTDIEKADILRKSHNLPFRAAPYRQSFNSEQQVCYLGD